MTLDRKEKAVMTSARGHQVTNSINFDIDVVRATGLIHRHCIKPPFVLGQGAVWTPEAAPE
jgi:hypothetical protein